MKKILGLFIAAMIVMALVGGGTWAFFLDTETSEDNTFTAGTLDLKLDDNDATVDDSETMTWSFDNLYPSDSGTATLTVTNAGSINGYVNLLNISLEDSENVNPESETDKNGYGELSEHLTVNLFWDANNNGSYDDGTDEQLYEGLLNAMDAQYYNNLPISSSSSKYLTMTYVWTPSETDNDAQGDKTTFAFEVLLTQNQQSYNMLSDYIEQLAANTSLSYTTYLGLDPEWKFGSSTEYDPTHWSGYIEKAMEKGDGDNTRPEVEGQNVIDYSNPYSDKTSIFNWNDWDGIKTGYYADFMPPAVILTNEANLAYSQNNQYIQDNIGTLAGAVVIYKDDSQSNDQAIVYFIYEDGSVSDASPIGDILP